MFGYLYLYKLPNIFLKLKNSGVKVYIYLLLNHNLNHILLLLLSGLFSFLLIIEEHKITVIKDSCITCQQKSNKSKKYFDYHKNSQDNHKLQCHTCCNIISKFILTYKFNLFKVDEQKDCNDTSSYDANKSHKHKQTQQSTTLLIDTEISFNIFFFLIKLPINEVMSLMR